jgi:hypothetical protein
VLGEIEFAPERKDEGSCGKLDRVALGSGVSVLKTLLKTVFRYAH